MKIRADFGAILLLTSIILSSGITYAAIYVFCAAAHEAGHLFAARVMKIRIREMNFDIAGAKIIPTSQIQSYGKEFLLCAAGPVASMLTCVIACFTCKFSYSAIGLEGIIFLITKEESPISAVVLFSLSQAIINLIPIDGFDGSSMLGAIVAYLFGERTKNTVLLVLSFVFALILWMASVYFLLKVGQGLSLFSFSICMFLKILENEK